MGNRKERDREMKFNCSGTEAIFLRERERERERHEHREANVTDNHFSVRDAENVFVFCAGYLGEAPFSVAFLHKKSYPSQSLSFPPFLSKTFHALF